MKYLISGTDIVGPWLDDSIDPPINLQVAESDLDLPIEQLYLEDGVILAKPPQTPGTWWNPATNNWESPAPIETGPNWEQLLASLRGTPIWAKTYTASTLTIKAAAAFNLLLTVLASIRNLQDLEFAIAQMREAMAEIPGIGDYSEEELDQINEWLLDTGFDLLLS